MNGKQMMKYVACVLATLDDVGGSSPRSPIYLALGANMEVFEIVEGFLKQAGLATGTSEELVLTAKGRAMATKINEVLKDSRPSVN